MVHANFSKNNNEYHAARPCSGGCSARTPGRAAPPSIIVTETSGSEISGSKSSKLDIRERRGTVVYNPRFKGKIKFPCFPNWPKDKLNVAEYIALFPNIMLGIHKDHFYIYWLEPINHALTFEHMEIYYVENNPANSKKYKNLRKQNYELWKGVQSEDLNIIEGMQEGRNSPSYNGGNFSPVMDNPTHHFHKWIATNLV